MELREHTTKLCLTEYQGAMADQKPTAGGAIDIIGSESCSRTRSGR